MKYFVTIAGRAFEVDLSSGIPRVDGAEVGAELVTVPGTAVRSLRVDGRSTTMLAHPGDGKGRWEISFGGGRFTAEVMDQRARAIREMAGGGGEEVQKTVAAPMPGLVVKVQVEPGQQVRAGQGVVVVEAMKMENELKAPADGVVARVEVQPGQTVEKGATLIVLE